MEKGIGRKEKGKAENRNQKAEKKDFRRILLIDTNYFNIHNELIPTRALGSISRSRALPGNEYFLRNSSFESPINYSQKN